MNTRSNYVNDWWSRAEMKMGCRRRKKILYIHGLGSDANSSTLQALEYEFPQYEWITDTFDLLDTAATMERIEELIREHRIGTIVASSLGASYALAVENSLAKIVINPCMRPSVELPRLVEGVDIRAFTAMENAIYSAIDDEMRFCTYGIFSTDDELFSYFPDFQRLYGSNLIKVKGGHRLMGESLISAVQSGFDYFKELNKRLRIR